MLLYRTIQGIGGGSLIPVSLAILRETFPPEEQGLAMSVYGMGVVLGPGHRPGPRRLADRSVRLAVDLLHQRARSPSSASRW